MADGGEPAGALACPEERKAPRDYVKWSEKTAERLLARLAAGEFLYRVARDPDMPTPEAVSKWAKQRPDFAARLDAARRAGGRPPGQRGPVSTFHDGMGEEVFERLCEGESLTRIGADPTMPCLSTLMRWRRREPGFEDTVQLGMRVRAERACDDGWELAMEATPETAYLTDVRLKHLRWMTGVMAPRVFRTRPAEPEAPQKVQTILFRHFKIRPDPQTGEDRIYMYCPDPVTGRIVCEDDEPDWDAPSGSIVLPGGYVE